MDIDGHLKRRNYIIILLMLFVSSCGNSGEMSAGKEKTLTFPNVNITYFPKQLGDTFLYVGLTHYADTLGGFDTSYIDTVKIYQMTLDSFYYRMKQVKYKEVPYFDANLEDITFVDIYDRFKINDSNKYVYESPGDLMSVMTTILFDNKDSLHFIDFIDRTSENKKDVRVFHGKLLSSR
jgi:hypothetical protein